MTDKITKFERMAMTKPVPMKLFAAWEVDRTPSNCIPSSAKESCATDGGLQRKLLDLCESDGSMDRTNLRFIRNGESSGVSLIP